jgi:hypothetical protein
LIGLSVREAVLDESTAFLGRASRLNWIRRIPALHHYPLEEGSIQGEIGFTEVVVEL